MIYCFKRSNASPEELEKQKIPVYRRELDELREALKSLRELRRGAYWVMAGNQGKIGGNPLDILVDYLRAFRIGLCQEKHLQA